MKIIKNMINLIIDSFTKCKLCTICTYFYYLFLWNVNSIDIKNAYKYLYKSDLRIEEAIEKISSLTEVSDEVTVMIDFLNQSSRGIVR